MSMLKRSSRMFAAMAVMCLLLAGTAFAQATGPVAAVTGFFDALESNNQALAWNYLAPETQTKIIDMIVAETKKIQPSAKDDISEADALLLQKLAQDPNGLASMLRTMFEVGDNEITNEFWQTMVASMDLNLMRTVEWTELDNDGYVAHVGVHGVAASFTVKKSDFWRVALLDEDE